jgi:dihydrofolate reductase
MLLEKPDDAPLGWLPQTYHQMDLKNAKTLGSPESIVRGLVRIRGLSARVKGISAGPTHRRYFHVMRPLRYSINVTLDGCCDHRAIPADEELHRHAVENLAQADALLFGRVTYEMMEAAWRPPARTGARPEWMEPWMEPFARTIDAAKKYVVSSTLDRVDWNAELVRGDLGKAVQQLKRESGKGLFVAGVKLPLALTELGLINEYEFVVHPRLAGHGPTLFAGLSKHVDLKLVSRLEFGSGAVAMRYEPRG